MRNEVPAFRRRTEQFISLAKECGFDLCGVAPVGEIPEYRFFEEWVRAGMAGQMRYLTDHRAGLRRDARSLLPSAVSVLCAGKVYRTQDPGAGRGTGRVSSYAWGSDYHGWMRRHLEMLVSRLKDEWGEFESKICVDTAPLLERAAAQSAGLGWIGRNTCLINERIGSWFFLGEILTSAGMEASTPPPDRCGTCRRCIDACPTQALVPTQQPEGPDYALDSRRCISYLTIELRGEIPSDLRTAIGDHLFGCDICQDVCPWNSKSPQALEPEYQPRHAFPDLEASAALTAEGFRERYRGSPVWRAKHEGFLRNVAVAMGNSGDSRYIPALRTLAEQAGPLVAEHAEWALSRLSSSTF